MRRQDTGLKTNQALYRARS